MGVDNMWDFLVVLWGWAQKKLGKQFNRIVVAVVILVAGWYANTGMTKMVALFDKITTIETNQRVTATDIQSIHTEISLVQDSQKAMQTTQVATAADVQKISTQVLTLQAVLVNKLNLILPPMGMTTDELEYSVCFSSR